MASTDIMGLNKTQMFAKLRKGFTTASPQLETQNILDVYDDILYVWDKKQRSIMCLNWKNLQVNTHDAHQVNDTVYLTNILRYFWRQNFLKSY